MWIEIIIQYLNLDQVYSDESSKSKVKGSSKMSVFMKELLDSFLDNK